MPELPDVEVFKRYLDATALHQEIEGIAVSDERVLADVSPQSLGRRLKGHALAETRRHGKHLFARADGAGWLRLHFGMSGFLRYFKREDKRPGHVRFEMAFTNGFCLAYDCRRLLGEVGWADSPEAFAQAGELGPDALNDLDADRLRELLAGRRGMLKAALMDQSLVAGIGNVYSDEILFQARLHPRTPVGDLAKKDFARLFEALQKVLQAAIEAQADPQKLPDGYLIPHRGKEGQCPRCGGPLEKIAVSGRKGYVCPKCQSGT